MLPALSVREDSRLLQDLARRNMEAETNNINSLAVCRFGMTNKML